MVKGDDKKWPWEFWLKATSVTRACFKERTTVVIVPLTCMPLLPRDRIHRLPDAEQLFVSLDHRIFIRASLNEFLSKWILCHEKQWRISDLENSESHIKSTCDTNFHFILSLGPRYFYHHGSLSPLPISILLITDQHIMSPPPPNTHTRTLLGQGGTSRFTVVSRRPNVSQRPCLCQTLFMQYFPQFFTNSFQILRYGDLGQDLHLMNNFSWRWHSFQGHRGSLCFKINFVYMKFPVLLCW